MHLKMFQKGSNQTCGSILSLTDLQKQPNATFVQLWLKQQEVPPKVFMAIWRNIQLLLPDILKNDHNFIWINYICERLYHEKFKIVYKNVQGRISFWFLEPYLIRHELLKDFQICFLGPRKYFQLVNPGGDAEGEFEDISETTKSKVWTHFLLNRIDSQAKCLHCSALLRVTKGSTKGLHNHLKGKHAIIVARFNDQSMYLRKSE